MHRVPVRDVENFYLYSAGDKKHQKTSESRRRGSPTS
jgi:hypothetical protein